MRLEAFLEQLANDAIRQALETEAPSLLRPARDSKLGDYQLNGLMPLAKRLGKAPRELAGPVAQQLNAHPAIERAEVAGPGFINLHLSHSLLSDALQGALQDLERDGVPAVATPQRVVVDFSAPNIAKQMHVGHLRSTIIGDAICRLLRYAGHHVIGDNHIGDWGTLFGLLIVGMRRFGDKDALSVRPIDELERVYKLASAAAKEDDGLAAEARAELAKLQQGDPENRSLWEGFVTATKAELHNVYERLDIHFDQWLGESAYDDMLPGVVEQLLERGIAREDQGAICVFFEGDKELAKVKTPFIVRKQDGAFLYSTTDIATVLYRRDHFEAQRAIYVVGQPQALHFKQLFSVAKQLGVEMRLEHVAFGSILGADGKTLRTRAGGTIKLAELLDEAEERAAARMREESELDEAQIAELKAAVGVGAVKYADLMQNRMSDYRFDWDKLISFKGNAGPYLQYAHARICSIFRKGEIDEAALPVPHSLVLEHPAELGLAKQLARFPDVVHQAAETCQPHLLCDHLYALARAFSVFFEACPVLKASAEAQPTRLCLTSLTGRQLRRGLGVLGIGAPQRM